MNNNNKFDGPDLQPLISRLMMLNARKIQMEKYHNEEIMSINEQIAGVRSQMKDIEPDCEKLEIKTGFVSDGQVRPS